MVAFPCPYCGHALVAETPDARLDRCSICDGMLLLGYRYRLVALRGAISGGVLYEAVDDGFGQKVAVLFVEDPADSVAVDRFIEGNRLFAELGGRGLVKLRDLGGRAERRPYVVMDWLAGGTLEAVVTKHGPLDAALMYEVGRDLLTGLSKAHRSMPALVHGHVHPGKIGFITADQAVLFGFEWAQQVHGGPSSLADAFIAEIKDDEGPHRETDLHQLGHALYYAATGDWLADQSVAQQRIRVRERLTGALCQAIDRMLGAGADGYTSAIDAVTDFDALMLGRSGWKPTVGHRQDRSGDLAGAAWVKDRVEPVRPAARVEFASASEPDVEPLDLDDALEELYDDDDDDDDDAPPPPPSSWSQSPSAPSPAHHSPTARAAAFAAAARSRELMAQAAAAQAPAQSPVKMMGLAIASLVVFGMCVAGISDDDADDYGEDYTIETIPVPRSAPEPYSRPEVKEIDESSLSGLHHYTGAVTGPEELAGLEIGDPCEIWVEPNDGGLNCRWYIDCGEPARRIYGGGTAGYSSCTVVDGHPVMAQDEDDDASDGAFMATLTDVDPMVMVVDRWLLPPTRVTIAIERGGPHPGPITDVPLAPRMSEATITAAINAGESPEFGREAEPTQLSTPEILEVLEASADEMRNCADAAEFDPSGTLELQIAIDIYKSGRVGAVNVSPSIDPRVKGCIAKVIRRVRFPTFVGDTMSITWNVTL